MVEGSGWDHPGGSEAITICGVNDDRDLVPALPPPAVYGRSYTDAEGRQVDPVRIAIWGVTSMLALCVLFLALAAWNSNAAASQNTIVSGAIYPLRTVFGDRGTNTASPYGPGGSETACTQETVDAQSGSWVCVQWSADTTGLPISAATAYTGGPCTEQTVDQSAGRWVCTQTNS